MIQSSLFDQMADLAKPRLTKKPWMETVELILGVPDLIPQVIQECIESGIYGLDLETSGLDQRAFPNDTGELETVDKIVGVCIAPTTSKGYYFPVRHKDQGAEANVPVRLIKEMIEKIQEGKAVAVFHNAKFDQKFLKYDPCGAIGEWDEPDTWHDTWILAYLRNSRQRQKGLKFLAGSELDREMFELHELFLKERGKKIDKDFSKLDPLWEPVLWYAAPDAINTLALFEILYPAISEEDQFGNAQNVIYTIEKICSTATMWMEQCRIFIDRKKLEELIRLGQQEWWECVNKVYDEVSAALGRDARPAWLGEMGRIFNKDVISPNYGEVRAMALTRVAEPARPSITKSVPGLVNKKQRETVHFPHTYDITIPASLGLLLREMNVPGLVPTEKSGQVKTSKDVLDKVIEDQGETLPWMKSVRRFRQITKSLGTTLLNIYKDSSPERAPDGCVWANFNGLKTDTGRFSTPTPRDKKNFHGQVNWNVQSTTATYDKSLPACSYRQREVVAAKPSYIFFAIDYSGVELRIVTNLSGEPKWVAEFFRCAPCGLEFDRGTEPPPFCPECGSNKIGDLHTLTAIGIYGSSDKLKRQTGKIVNFLLCYGGSGIAVQRSTGCNEEEGWRIKNQFDKTYRGLQAWWRAQERLAKKQKYVTTAFGRKYPVPDIDHEYNKFRSKAKRNAVNGPVQGTSADIMKLAMGLLYREFKRRGWINRGPGLEDLVRMVLTIHDELGFEIHESIVDEAIQVICDIMCRKTVGQLGWLIPLKVDVEFGANWTVPNNLTEMSYNKGGGDWTPYLAKVFPTYYANYLEHGGTPVAEKEEPPPSDDNGGGAPSEGPPGPDHPDACTTCSGHGYTPFEDSCSKCEGSGFRADGNSNPPDGSSGGSSEIPSPVPPPSSTVGQDGLGSVASPRGHSREPGKVSRVGDGREFVYKIQSHLLTPDNAEKLARVVQRCQGRGTDSVRIQSTGGTDLLGHPVRVALDEFKIIAQYEGL